VPANSADAKKFDGEGDDSFAASEGQERSGVIDPSKLPETPITKTVSAPPPASQSAQPAGAKVVSAVVKPSQTAAKPVAQVATAKSGGPMIQLGAYNNEAQAKSSWSRLAKRFDYLSALTYSIEPVTVNGTQFYRLRVATPQANILCGKLKVAGENCMVVN
jgi:cell division septation protein DedD